MIEVQCTWGEGPDVLVIVEHKATPEECQGFPLVDVGDKSSFGLSVKAARQLAIDLTAAADQAERLNRGWSLAGSKDAQCVASSLGRRCTLPMHFDRKHKFG
jgi:hypothetical protein